MSNHAGDSERPDPAAPASEAPAASPPRQENPGSQPAQNRLGILSAFVLVIVLGVVIASHWPAFTGTGSTQSPSLAAADDANVNANQGDSAAAASLRRELAALTARLEAAEASLGAANRSGTPTQAGTGTSFDVATRLGNLDARLSAVESRAARAADRDVQISLQERLTRLESETSGAALRRAAKVLALATLARAAGEATSFKPQLDAMAALVPADPGVSALAPFAAQGAPTLAMLRARFPEAARNALDAERGSAGNGIFGQLWAGFTRVVRIRRVGEVTGNSTAAHLARAETDLNRDDLPGAIAEVRALANPSAAAIAPWLKDAEARIEVDRALDDIDLRIVQALATPSSSEDDIAREQPSGRRP